MSYTLTMTCGCTVYVSRHPDTGVAHTRVIERRAPACRDRKHDVGAKLWLWDLRPATGSAVSSAAEPRGQRPGQMPSAPPSGHSPQLDPVRR